ncbi:MAG: hypothetical protein C0P79_008515 [Gammaproteobacteria bacterium]|nr:hypothetical protein [Gammaproteobacteria bacterium]
MSNRVKQTLARHERMRRSRDHAWMYFAAFAAAAIFGWIAGVNALTAEPRAAWWALSIYGLIALLSTVLAYRAFGAATRLSRRLDESRPLDETESGSSAWDEIWGKRS